MANTGILIQVNGSRPNTYSNLGNTITITPTNRNPDADGSKVISLPGDAYQSPNLNQGNVVSLVDLGKKLLEASRDGETEEVGELISKGAPFTTDWLGTSPLHLAAQNGHTSTCEKLLTAGISKDARTKVDKTPLHIAAQEDHAEVVELLLGSKCNIDAQDLLDMTPLHWATEKCNVVSVETLLRFGANTTIQNKFGKSPLELASDQNRPDIYEMLQNPEVYRQTDLLSLQQDEASTLAATNSIMSPNSSNNLEFFDSIDKVMEDLEVNSSEERAKASFQEKAIRELQGLFQPETEPTIMVTAPSTVTTTATPTAVGSNSSDNSSKIQRTISLTEAGKLALGSKPTPIRPMSAKIVTLGKGNKIGNISLANHSTSKQPTRIIKLSQSDFAALKSGKTTKLIMEKKSNMSTTPASALPGLSEPRKTVQILKLASSTSGVTSTSSASSISSSTNAVLDSFTLQRELQDARKETEEAKKSAEELKQQMAQQQEQMEAMKKMIEELQKNQERN